MSLATRCTACGTAFRVVQDQLNVSEGWVRCGRCGEVFNALSGLFDLERETPPEWQQPKAEGAGDPAESVDSSEFESGKETSLDIAEPPGASTPIDGMQAPDEPLLPGTPADRSVGPRTRARASARDPARADDAWAEEEASESAAAIDEEIDAHLFGARRTPKGRAHAVHVSERDRLDFSDARFDSDLLADAADPQELHDPLHATAPVELPLERSTGAPEFLRRAESRARWQRPRMRAALGVATLALLAGLALQVGHHFRDFVFVRWPTLQPVLAQWCALATCSIEPPRHIEDISVESTALARAVGADAFRLAVTLRNHGSVPLTMPWIDLSLTDTSGKLVARRALAARDFTPVTTTLQPGTEVVLQTLLAARNARPSGYTVEIFYP